MGRREIGAFTLIELLVVVTIIVVLLALLTPALDRAIYQAELVNCGARLDAMGTGAILYAHDHNRRYPYRPGNLERDQTNSWAANELANTRQGNNPLENRDVRPIIKSHINPKNWECPLSSPIDLSEEGTPEGGRVFAGYNMFFGFAYAAATNWPSSATKGKGMMKLGDQWSFVQDPASPATSTVRFKVLANDVDWISGNGGAYGSHPDDAGTMSEQYFDGRPPWYTDAPWTWSYWQKPGGTTNPIARGLIDVNAVFDDGSVRRYNGVKAAQNAQTSPQKGIDPNFTDVAQVDTRLGYPDDWINVPLR